MTDQTIPADKVRKIASEMRAAMRREEDDYPEAKFLADLSGYIRDLEALLPQRPTLADMTADERDECWWLQADTESWGRVVILNPYAIGGNVTLVDDRGAVITENHARVTPRPDLPRMAWPGDQKAALEETPESEEEFMANIEKALDDHYGPLPVPALPDGWRLADHEDYGRGIVTNTTTNRDGRVYFVTPADDPMGYDWLFCTPDELTYPDTEPEEA